MVSCKNCGSSEVEDNGKEVVCQGCGLVVEEDGIQFSFVERDHIKTSGPVYSAKPYYLKRRNGSNAKLSEGRDLCKTFSKNVCSSLGCPPGMVDEVLYLISTVLDNEYFNHRHLETKKTISACCIYLILRNSQWPFTFNDIRMHCRDTQPNFEHWKSQLVIHFPHLAEYDKKLDICDLAERISKTLDFSKTLTSTTMKILRLSHALWLTEDHKPESLVFASCFCAWVSEDVPCRIDTKVKQFCKIHKILNKVKMISRGSSLILDALRQLAEQIPWYVPGSGSEGLKVLLHLNNILDFQKILISEAIGKIKGDAPEGPGKRPRTDDESAYEIRKKVRPQKVSEVDEGRSFELPANVDLSREDLDEDDMDEQTLREYIRDPSEIPTSNDIRDFCEVTKD